MPLHNNMNLPPSCRSLTLPLFRAVNVVSRSYVARVAREREQAGVTPELL